MTVQLCSSLNSTVATNNLFVATVHIFVRGKIDLMYIRRVEIDKDLEKNAERYVSQINTIRLLKNINFTKPITFFVGENGTGKSTLLEAIAVALGFNAEGGSKNFTFSTYSSYSSLYKNLKIIKAPYHPRDGYFLRSESFYNVATSIEEMDSIECDAPPVKLAYGGKCLHNLSHGESVLTLILERFIGNGLYILDEPETALSPTNQLSILAKIYNLSTKKNSQFIIVTHSPILMACPESEIFLFDKNGVRNINYTETEHYNLTKHFLNSPQSILTKIL